MAVGTQDADSQGALVAREKAKLRKVLRRFDLILFTACAIVGLESVALAAQAGAQAITWLLVSLVLFFVPYGMVVAELAIAGIILVIPKAGLSTVSGFTDAYKAVSHDLHSGALDVVFGVLIVLTLIGSGAVWLQGADRIQPSPR
jgi:hypothetical protein